MLEKLVKNAELKFKWENTAHRTLHEPRRSLNKISILHLKKLMKNAEKF